MYGRRVALSALGLACGLAMTACGSGSSGYAPDPAPPTYPATAPAPAAAKPAGAAANSAASSAASSPTATNAVPSSPARPTAAPKPAGLQLGDKGPQVLALQKRLAQLGFWIAAPDGSFGDTTQQAVIAVQKAAGLGRDGVAGPQTMAVVKRGLSVSPRSTSGHWIEIDKTRQLLLLVTDGKVEDVFNTSTGSGQAYQEGGQTYTATTPSGQFSIFRQVDRLDPGPLGDLWRPKYFNGGIAVHGAPVVPAYPASHGCARLTNAAIDWIWSSNEAPIGTRVWVY